MLQEDRELGRQLTETILGDPEVQDGIAAVQADSTRWDALLGPGRYQPKQP
jgi:hypothetical protein